MLPRLLNHHSNCIDIGCHKGAFLEMFQSYAPNGKHLAFEPIPSLYQALANKYKNIEISEIALSDSKGTALFHIPRNGLAWSGFELQEYPLEMEIEQISVSTDLLDQQIPSEYTPDFIKVDVEGAELKVFNGGKDVISRSCPAVLFEHALVHNKNYQITPGLVFEFFKDCEMDIFSMDLLIKYSKQEFEDVYFLSFESNYDRNAETNFIAVNTRRLS